MSDIYGVLDKLGIFYTRFDHPPFYTCEDADAFYQTMAKSGGTCKNLFIRNRKGDKHYLVIVPSTKRADLRLLERILSEKGLSFASPERLDKYLGLKPGSVSPFGLINDKRKEVQVVIDRNLLEFPKLYFHPNVNTATLEIATGDFKKFIEAMGRVLKESRL